MSLLRLVIRSLLYYRRTNAAVVLGAAVGVAVVTGSLLVGDSVKGSLRDLALGRLGRTDAALQSAGFFRAELAREVAGEGGVRSHFDGCVATLLAEAAASRPDGAATVPAVSVVGVDEGFDRLWSEGEGVGVPAPGEAVVNEALAQDLGLAEGDAVIVRVPRPDFASAESLFGRRRRAENVLSFRVTIARIVPEAGAGRFSLRSDRVRPRNVFVSLEWLQARLDRPGLVNTLLGVGLTDAAAGGETLEMLAGALADHVTPADYGLRFVENRDNGYVSLESRGVVLPPQVVTAAQEAAGRAKLSVQLTSVYLANRLTRVGGAEGEARFTPYSIVAGMDVSGDRLTSATGEAMPAELSAGEIILSEWTAGDLGAKVGDAVDMSFYRVGRDGTLSDEHRRFVVRGLAAMSGAAVDGGLSPKVEGVTDTDDMKAWHPPFPIDLDVIRPKDEAFWREHRAAPKAFISLDAARHLWQVGHEGDSSEGVGAAWVTSVRLASDGAIPDAAAQAIFAKELMRRLPPASMGMVFRPQKAMALAAAEGSTDYASLFLGLSSFLVIAAALLVGLLLRLSIESRARQAGMLAAIGFRPRAVSWSLLAEGAVLALVAVAAGVPLGIAYAAGILLALGTLWVGVLGPFPLALHVTAESLVIGGAVGLAVAVLAAWWATRMLRRREAVWLLGGWRDEGGRVGGRKGIVVGICAIVGAAVVIVLTTVAGVMDATGAFFLSGALLLTGGIALTPAAMGYGGGGALRLTIGRLARRYALRNRARSVLTAGLLASASFVIVAVAANRNDPAGRNPLERNSGTGGFTLVADSSVPIYVDLDTAAGRREAGIGPEGEAALAGTRIYSFRVREGDDASCLNVQRPLSPRVVGVPQAMIDRGGFAFASVASQDIATTGNPWRLLNSSTAGEGAVPAIGDEASVMWILHSKLGGEIPVAGRGGDVGLRMVALLKNSLWQSDLLVSDAEFVRHFGGGGGYRRFLIATPAGDELKVAEALRRDLGDLGFDVRPTGEVLAEYAGVQNAYLSTFQTLGGLGLVLGAFGVVAVLLRGVVERRRELAVMLAMGFTRAGLVRLVATENVLLLVTGLVVGTVSGMVAVGPQLAQAGGDVSWATLAVSLAAVLGVGVVACVVAAWWAMRGELIPAIRSE